MKNKRKKLKRRIRRSTLFFLIIALITNSFAWFIYTNKVSNSINTHVKSWKVTFDQDGNPLEDTVEFKDLKLNMKNRKAFIKDEEIILQGKQFDILEYLINSKGTIITKEQIFDKIWGFDSFTTTNVVEVYASGLRKTLKKYGYDKYIKTIRGVGYMIIE